jgi:hypothetical protein
MPVSASGAGLGSPGRLAIGEQLLRRRRAQPATHHCVQPYSGIPATLDASAGGAVEQLTSVEICAGAGGQALGLEQAGFAHQGVVELDADACRTLWRNKAARWTIIQADVAEVDGRKFAQVDLLAGGLPCPPFSIAGKQRGHHDERDLFPHALRLAEQISPRAVLLENVPGLAAAPVRQLPRSGSSQAAWPGLSDMVAPDAGQPARRPPAAAPVRAGGDQIAVGGLVRLARAVAGAARHGRRGAR